MIKDQIVDRMNELGDIAKERMLSSADYPNKVFAEIMHMTQEETEEMLQLRLMLPGNGEERGAAKLRIKEKIKLRKDLRESIA